MAVDIPARIAVLGAGPIGLEAALYARFLGYDVDVYERGRVADHLRRWGHVRLFSPFGMNRSTLGLAALAAQDDGYRPPADDALLTGHEYLEQYLLPLSRTDLLADSIHEQVEVLAVGRDGPGKSHLVGSDERADFDFRILLRQAEGRQQIAAADVVIDTTGTYGNHNWLGQGGIPALGEMELVHRIEYGLADVLGRDRQRYAGRHTLLLGAGFSAATTVVALAELALQASGTRVTWIARAPHQTESISFAGPIPVIPDDCLTERAGLTTAANALAAGGSPHVAFRPGLAIDAVSFEAATSRFAVQLLGEQHESIEVDEIVANVGYRPDPRLYAELQVHECYASGGPMKLAASLLGQASADCLDQTSGGPQTLLTPEPDFYILGAKSYGRNSRFLISVGLRQIRELFTIVGDRADLDLYTSIGKLPR